jgi:hypothetical protein
MANSTATLTVRAYPHGIDNTQRSQIVRGTVAITTGFYPSGGYVVNWATLSQGGSGQGVESIPVAFSGLSSSITTPFPVDVDIKSVAANTSPYGKGPSGYIYVWDNVNGNIHIFQSATNAASGNSGPLVEFGGAIPNTIVNDRITFTAVYQRG